MIFTLKAYRDLGQCSYGTLREMFDTEKDEIYLNSRKIEVRKIEDLFPFLWQSPGISGRIGESSFALFQDRVTHWHRDFDESIEREERSIENLKKRIGRSDVPKKIEKLKVTMNSHVHHRDSLMKLCEESDREMEEQKRLLIEENDHLHDRNK